MTRFLWMKNTTCGECWCCSRHAGCYSNGTYNIFCLEVASSRWWMSPAVTLPTDACRCYFIWLNTPRKQVEKCSHIKSMYVSYTVPLVIAGHQSVKGVLTPNLEGDFTLPYQSLVYRDGSAQVWCSVNTDKIFYLNIKVNFRMAHLLASTLSWHQATASILVTSRTRMSSCDDAMCQNIQNGCL